jgi:protein-S-isoprenylcysteine O-methyltransferase Ste14
MNIIGKTTIHPALFYSGKIIGYSCWIIMFYTLVNSAVNATFTLSIYQIVSLLILFAGLLLSIVSIFNLGRSTRLGLPDENTAFKTGGLYKISRNPMYLGFNLLTVAVMLYNLSIVIVLLGLYSITIYHFIILGEERFMQNRFGDDYLRYKQKTRRYL